MKKAIMVTMLVVGVAFMAPSNAHAYLNNWYFNPNGTGFGGATQISSYLDVVGSSLIEVDTGAGTFKEGGALVSPLHDGGTLYPGGSNQFTTVFKASGFLTGSQSFTFTSGQALIYADPVADFAPETFLPDGSMMRADNTAAIGQFNITLGGGKLNDDYTPNGFITAILEAQSLNAGYFFDNAGNDLSQWTLTSGNLPMLTLGFFTTNGSVNPNPSLGMLGEYNENLVKLGLDPITNDATHTSFIVGNNGQFKLDVVPEPATMTLLGLGLAGLAGLRRKK